MSSYAVRWVSQISEIEKSEWQKLALQTGYPFMEWDFLRAMEDSGSISPRTGWIPHHLTLQQKGRLAAALPLYIKVNSRAEFVFDYVWADAADQLGIAYYPKMVGMCPATPVGGYSILVSPELDEQETAARMVQELDTFCRENGICSLQFNFIDDHWADILCRESFTPWIHQGYLWENTNFKTFDDYLAVFRKNQRKNIRKERAQLSTHNMHIEMQLGDEVPPHYYERMYDFYKGTNDKFGPWAAEYLNRRFFMELMDGAAEHLLFASAFTPQSKEPVAMSLLLRSDSFLAGRYWGTSYEYKDLHFNACYYAPIEWAIENGIRLFDPGMGSHHKIRRGFKAVAQKSLHKFYDDRMDVIFRSNIDVFNQAALREIEVLNEALPLHRDFLSIYL
jgi:hypothetical protein